MPFPSGCVAMNYANNSQAPICFAAANEQDEFFASARKFTQIPFACGA
jgi:hypothetical protein